MKIRAALIIFLLVLMSISVSAATPREEFSGTLEGLTAWKSLDEAVQKRITGAIKAGHFDGYTTPTGLTRSGTKTSFSF